MDNRPFGTCFFEQYAQITLATFLGGEMTTLVNRDRPDLQSPDGASVGIEVTRAMEENKLAQEALLKDISGITPGPKNDDLDIILENGYAFGMKRILESKVSKVGNGFYGHFGKMGLFVFSRENLGETDARKAMDYTLFLQKYQDLRYDRLYIADVNDLFVCNLDEGLKEGSRMIRYRIFQEQRKAFYLEAIRRQNESVQQL